MTSPMSHTLTNHSAMHTLVVDARFVQKWPSVYYV